MKVLEVQNRDLEIWPIGAKYTCGAGYDGKVTPEHGCGTKVEIEDRGDFYKRHEMLPNGTWKEYTFYRCPTCGREHRIFKA